MRRSTPLAIVAAALFAALPLAVDRGPVPRLTVATAEAAVDVEINLFFTSLTPYGVWIPNPTYNFVWVPTQVDADWAPYTNGYWVYTALYGWYFVSNEPFAPIVYHYGRWGYDPAIGWYWVPGTKFAGAWVAWRRSGDTIGWAALPPHGSGYITTVSITINIGSLPPYYWRFVPVTQFLARELRTVSFRGDSRPEVFGATQPAGTVVVQNNIVVNNIINLTFIEQQTKQKVEVAKVEEVSQPQQAQAAQATPASVRAFVADVKAADRAVAPPKVVAKTDVEPPTKGQVATTTAGGAAGAQIGTLPPEDKAQPGAAPADPRCRDEAFAKANPRNCPAAATAATPSPGTTAPPAGAQPTQGAAGGQGTATETNPRCADPTFAKNNPRTCGAAPEGQATTAPTAGTPPTGGPSTQGAVGGQGGGANANVGNPRCADPTLARNNPRTCDATAAPGGPPAGTTGSANVEGSTGAATGGTRSGTTGGTSVQGNVAADPRCADTRFARNNPKTCGAPAGATGGPNAEATSGDTSGGGAAANTGAGARSGGSPGGSVSVQGNVNVGNPRCADPMFARNNPKTCVAQSKGGDASSGATTPAIDY